MRFDDDKTPTVIHARPAPVVVRSGTAPLSSYPLPARAGTPPGIAPVSGPEVFETDEEPTRPDGRAFRTACLVADWNTLEAEQQRWLERTARRMADICRARRVADAAQKKDKPDGRY